MKFLIERPVAVAMVFCCLLAMGVYSYFQTPLELAPKENYPEITIYTSWPGTPPEVIQTRITAPIEEAVSGVKAVRKVSSTSDIGTSNVKVEFDPKADMEFILLALREELSNLSEVLPPGVRPNIQPWIPEEFAVRPFLQYTVSGSGSIQTLRGVVKDKIIFGLGAVKGVSQVRVIGGSDPEFRVVLDKAKLKAYNLHPRTIAFAIADRMRTRPSGPILDGTQELLFKFVDSIRDKNELAETVVGYAGGNALRVRDVASVETTFSEIMDIHRINGKPTVSFTVYKETGANTLQVAKAVKAKLDVLRRELPSNLVFKKVSDESDDIDSNLKELYRLVVIITIVVFLMIYVVLRRFKPSLLILTSIAFSVVITFNLIYFFKISLNMLTLGALALGFGMFVDNSIVVFENILRLRESGMDPKEAAVRGPKEVFVAVMASTLTTIAVFCTFPFFQGRLKIYYLPLAIVIGSALTASLFISYTLIPALSPMLLERRRGQTVNKPGRFFGRFLRLCFRHPLEVILLAAAALVGSFFWFKAEVPIGSWGSWTPKQILSVYINLPAGTEIRRTDEVLRAFEDVALADPSPKEMNAYILGISGQINITFPPEIERSSVPYLIKDQLIQKAAQFAGLNLYVSGFDPQSYSSNMGVGAMFGSRIKFYGYNLKKLKEITADVERTLRRNPRIKDVNITSNKYGWSRVDSRENILKLDQNKLRSYDIDPQYLYSFLGTLLTGSFGRPPKIKAGGDEISVWVKFPEADALDIRGVQDALVQSRRGEYIRLAEIVEFSERPIAGSIDRENQQFQQTVSWEFRGPSKAEEKYRKGVFASLHLPPGFSATLEGYEWMTKEETSQIWMAIVVALIVIFMIIAALFESIIQPFIILLTVPLGLIGVFIAFIVAKASFTSAAFIGVILLAGIVVNNSILLVDHINHKRSDGLNLIEAAIEGARERLRPIIMTTGTTVFGIIPMLLIPTETGKLKIWSALALCTAGGLVSSTLLLMVVIPVIYVHADRLRHWTATRWKQIRRRS